MQHTDLSRDDNGPFRNPGPLRRQNCFPIGLLSFPLTTREAAATLGISLRELQYTLKRFEHNHDIVEKHGRKNLFYREHIELIRSVRRKSATQSHKQSMGPATAKLQEDYAKIVASLRKNRKEQQDSNGGRNV